MTPTEEFLYNHRQNALVCYDHEGYCCICGRHDQPGFRTHLADAIDELREPEQNMLDYLQSVLWDTLQDNIRRALNGYWSIACEGTVERLVWLIRMRGVISADKINIPILKGGVYHAVCELAQVKPNMPDDFDLSRYEQYWHDWELLAKAISEIRKMEVEDFTVND